MTSRADQVRGRGIGDRANHLVDLLASLSDQIPDDQKDGLERLKYVASVASEYPGACDGELVNPDAENGLATAIESGVAPLEAFPGDNDPIHFGEAVGAADAIVAAFRLWPSPIADDQFADLRQRIAGLRSHITSLETAFGQRVAETTAAVAQARAELQDGRARSVEAVSQAAEGATAALNERVEQLQQRITEQEPRLDEAIARFEGNFSTSEDDRRRRFDEQFDAHKARVNELESSSDKRLNDIADELHQRREATEAELNAITKEAEDIVGVISNTGMTGGYQLRYRSERIQAEVWRVLTVVFGIATVGVLVWVADHVSKTGKVETGLLTARIAISVAVASLATYAARQSHNHRENADAAREQQLALASLPAFLQQLEPTDRQGILQTLAFVYFTPQRLQGDEVTEAGEAVSPFIRMLSGYAKRRKSAPPTDDA